MLNFTDDEINDNVSTEIKNRDKSIGVKIATWDDMDTKIVLNNKNSTKTINQDQENQQTIKIDKKKENDEKVKDNIKIELEDKSNSDQNDNEKIEYTQKEKTNIASNFEKNMEYASNNIQKSLNLNMNISNSFDENNQNNEFWIDTEKHTESVMQKILVYDAENIMQRNIDFLNYQEYNNDSSNNFNTKDLQKNEQYMLHELDNEIKITEDQFLPSFKNWISYDTDQNIGIKLNQKVEFVDIDNPGIQNLIFSYNNNFNINDNMSSSNFIKKPLKIKNKQKRKFSQKYNNEEDEFIKNLHKNYYNLQESEENFRTDSQNNKLDKNDLSYIIKYMPYCILEILI